jgi:uncharacterized protein (TIGR00255 family)
MRSMTGFASKKAILTLGDNKVYTTVSLKSVNARFFECACKFPYALHHLETKFIKLLKKELHRGHVFMSINVSDQSAFKGTITASIPIAKRYTQMSYLMQQETGVGGTFTISDLVDLPNVFSVEEQLADDHVNEQLTILVHETIQALIAEQEKEGNALRIDLMQRVTLVQTYMDEIKKLHKAFMAQRKQEILHELQSYTGEDDIVEARKAALYYLLDKIDIHEEIIRFESHLSSLKHLIESSSTENGKRLDFTLQELNREINTIAAKCSHATMGARAIDIKVELEKAREQAQNIV